MAEREIKNAIDNRFVVIDPLNPGGGVSIMGYSQGGGVVQNMIEDELDPISNPQYFPIYAVYLDAVRHDFATMETDWPNEVFFLLNIYQSMPGQLGGGDINDTEVTPGAELEEVDVTTTPGWNASLEHFDIDDDLQVQMEILLWQDLLLDR